MQVFFWKYIFRRHALSNNGGGLKYIALT
jgi:hypothetical protein